MWLHNDDELHIADNPHKYVLNKTELALTIKDIGHEDEGNYSCKYRNGLEVQQDAGCLFVYGECTIMQFILHRGIVTNLVVGLVLTGPLFKFLWPCPLPTPMRWT